MLGSIDFTGWYAWLVYLAAAYLSSKCAIAPRSSRRAGERFDCGAVGSVVNLASRLGNEAAGGQILLGRRVVAEVEEIVETEPVGEVELKGFHARSGS